MLALLVLSHQGPVDQVAPADPLPRCGEPRARSRAHFSETRFNLVGPPAACTELADDIAHGAGDKIHGDEAAELAPPYLPRSGAARRRTAKKTRCGSGDAAGRRRQCRRAGGRWEGSGAEPPRASSGSGSGQRASAVGGGGRGAPPPGGGNVAAVPR
jgi:hypothetical protein